MNIVITGANRGIGLSLCQYYNEQHAQVFAVCRNASDDLQMPGVTVIDGIDVTDPVCVNTLVNKLADTSIDLLINNAGLLSDEVLGNIDYDSIEKQFQINALAPLRVAEALLPNMQAGGKIMMVTSRMGSIDDNTSGGRYGYRMSKAALNMASVSLAHDLAARKIAVGIVHPGFVQTEMVGFNGDISSTVAAERIAARIEDLNLDNSGSFWHSNGEQLPW